MKVLYIIGAGKFGPNKIKDSTSIFFRHHFSGGKLCYSLQQVYSHFRDFFHFPQFYGKIGVILTYLLILVKISVQKITTYFFIVIIYSMTFAYTELFQFPYCFITLSISSLAQSLRLHSGLFFVKKVQLKLFLRMNQLRNVLHSIMIFNRNLNFLGLEQTTVDCNAFLCRIPQQLSDLKMEKLCN